MQHSRHAAPPQLRINYASPTHAVACQGRALCAAARRCAANSACLNRQHLGDDAVRQLRNLRVDAGHAGLALLLQRGGGGLQLSVELGLGRSNLLGRLGISGRLRLGDGSGGVIARGADNGVRLVLRGSDSWV